ncbi:LOW QUALITY PROTEIN: piggyBac transposable element-derived protein 4-like [Vespula squamosa]|uniref:PiggyBac transposable element-derived protein 4-like n=1 Tax=Vespula squamosa TaxID=30214 RepID=A0ABD2BS64_VESSQ
MKRSIDKMNIRSTENQRLRRDTNNQIWYSLNVWWIIVRLTSSFPQYRNSSKCTAKHEIVSDRRCFNSQLVARYLNKIYEAKWIGTRGQILWSHNSTSFYGNTSRIRCILKPLLMLRTSSYKIKITKITEKTPGMRLRNVKKLRKLDCNNIKNGSTSAPVLVAWNNLNNKGITILKWKNKRDFLVLFTKYSVQMINIHAKRGFCRKLKIIIEYNAGKIAIDLSNQMNAYSNPL